LGSVGTSLTKGEGSRAHTNDRARVVGPPPLILFGFLGVGLVLHLVAPINFFPGSFQPGLGLPLVGMGILLLLWATQTLLRADTDVRFRRPTKVLVVRDPYRFSRNPIYLGLMLVYLGITVSVNALWPLLLLPVVFMVIQRGVIYREERYLQEKFGEDFSGYKRKVRRWI